MRIPYHVATRAFVMRYPAYNGALPGGLETGSNFPSSRRKYDYPMRQTHSSRE
jgi:hypothetical protein